MQTCSIMSYPTKSYNSEHTYILQNVGVYDPLRQKRSQEY